MRVKYSTIDPSQNEFDSLPRMQFVLEREGRRLDVIGLVDSGATVNVLPYEMGMQLGGTWNDDQAKIRLTGNWVGSDAIPFFATAYIGSFPHVRLAFAWVKTTQLPLILGQTNFFMEFDVHFYRSRLEFEINPKFPA